jgi:hypothetical protein
MDNRLPPQHVVQHWLSYDRGSGVFTWQREPRPIRPLIGKTAGSSGTRGYVLICLPGHAQVGAHRLAWIYVHGSIPDGMEIDHRDGNPSNNAIDNLRLATSSQQKMNKKVQSNNRSGLKGAYYHAAHKGKKWRSQIRSGGRIVFLGYYETAEEAHSAYAEAALREFGEFARAE